jgi:hypothetical protein
LGSSPILDPSHTSSFFFFFGFFVFDLVVILAKLFSVMKIVQQELPKFETKLEFFLKCHCWALMGAQGWQQKLELGLGSILVFLFFFCFFFVVSFTNLLLASTIAWRELQEPKLRLNSFLDSSLSLNFFIFFRLHRQTCVGIQ